MTKLKSKVSISGRTAASLILFAGLMILMFFVIAESDKNTDAENVSVDFPDVKELSGGWVVSGSAAESINGYSFTGKTAAANIVPDDVSGAPVLFFDSRGFACKVYIDSKEIYSYGGGQDFDRSKILSEINCFIKLNEADKGKPMVIEFDSYDSEGALPSVYYSSESGILKYLFANDGFTILFSALLLFMSLCLIFIYIVFILKKIALQNKCLFYLGAFILLANVWIITNTLTLQFIAEKITVITLISYYSFALLPVLFLLFIGDFCTYGKKLISWFCMAELAVLIGLSVSFLAGGPDIAETLPVVHGMSALSDIVAVICIEVNIKKKKDRRTCRRLLYATFVLAGFSAVQLLSYYIKSDFAVNSLWFEAGLLIFIIMLARLFMYKAIDFLEINAQNSIYKKLLYTDSLTQLGSRAGFDQYIDMLGKKLCCGDKISFLVMDLNNLKETNDVLGHMSGDKLIKDMAECIKTAFGAGVKSFRIGGDEFVSVFVNSEMTSQNARRELLSVIERFNLAYHSNISVSIGCCDSKIRGSVPKTDILNAFKQADNNMYAVKSEMHRITGKTR
ncbi:GGDEF domain-containing protein [Ruminococcus sp. Marseille-P6503]|uniref:GGDEF domain-containing protein n=1 Tax=Ruminococcus sp. Marseille-P6503 TaxID=2364796 RepID=UPI000F51AFBE|nr:GGDEF domain-containing protein [Ruminococcus sp. Marseille-P6503]